MKLIVVGALTVYLVFFIFNVVAICHGQKCSILRAIVLSAGARVACLFIGLTVALHGQFQPFITLEKLDEFRLKKLNRRG